MANDLDASMDAYDAQQGGSVNRAANDPLASAMDAYDKVAPARLRANLAQSVGTNSAQYAKQRADGQTLGVAPAVVAAQPTLEQQAQVQRIDQATQAAPALRQAYTDADFAKLAHADHGTLAAIEHALLYTVGALPAETMPDGTRVSEYQQASAAGDLFRMAHVGLNKMASAVDMPIAAFPVARDKIVSLMTGKDTTESQDAYFDYTQRDPDAYNQSVAIPGSAPFERKAVGAVGELVPTLMAAMLTGGASESAQVPTMGKFLMDTAAHTTKAMALPAIGEMGDTYRKVLAETGDQSAAMRAGLAQYAVTTAGGLTPLNAPGGLLSRLAWGGVSGVVSGEASREAMNAVLPVNMQTQFDAENAILSGLTGMAMAGALGPRAIPSLHGAIRQTYIDAAQAARAERGAAAIDAVSDLSQKSTLRNDDPATFKQLVASMADHPDAVKAVYVSGEDLHNAMASSPDATKLAQDMPDVVKQIEQARSTSGDVKIPIEDYATHIAGTDVDKAIRPGLKVDADGMTFKESQDHYAQQVETFKQTSADAGKGLADEAQRHADLDEIRKTLTAQVVATGRYSKVAAAHTVEALTSFYGTMSARAGMTPAEMFAAHPVRVSRGGVDEGVNHDGLPKVGELSVDGYHFSKEQRPVLSSAAHSVNAKDAPKDARLRRRLSFYADTGNGIAPKKSLGEFGHRAELGNVYDARTDPLKLKDKPDFESKVLDAGFAGYLDQPKGQKQATVTMLGDHTITPSAVKAEGLKGRNVDEKPLAQAERAGAPVDEHREAAKALLEMGRHEGLFQYPKSSAKTMEQIARDKSPGLHVAAETITQMDGSEKHTGNWDVIMPDGDGTAIITERDGKVWINVAGLKSGGRGSLVYDLAANYAHNNGLKFVGDPAGVSKAAMIRRAENMLSSAVKYGTTDHLSPHPEQLKGNETVPGLDWKDGDSVGNVRSLMSATMGANEKLAPAARGIVYDGTDGHFKDSAGNVVDAADILGELADLGRGAGGAGAPGQTTLRRNALFDSLLQGEGARRAILAGLHRISGDGSADAGGALQGSFYHVSDDVARGEFDPRTSTISLLKSANLSTFLHESGHFFLETIHDLARQGADPGITADRDALLKWMGVKDAATWDAMTLDERRAGHEKFARGFERYLMEGKAPSIDLQPMFSRFRSWLVHIYESLTHRELRGAEISPEVRGVMDRMLASEEAIKQAEATRGYFGMDKPPEGADPKDFEAYQRLGAQATDAATDDMTQRSMRDMRWASNAKRFWTKGFEQEAKAARAKITDEVSSQVRDMPVYKAKAFLDKNAGQTDESKAATKAWKGQRDAERNTVREAVAAETAAKSDATGLEKAQFMSRNKRAIDNETDRRMLEWEQSNPKPRPERNPLELDVIAERFGYGSGDEMLRAIHEADPAKDVIEGVTDQRMLEEHGELVDPVSIERAAEAAIHNEVRARFMATGLKMLTKSGVPARRLANAAEEAAQSAISAKKVKDLSPASHSIAEARANKLVLKLAPKATPEAVQAQRAALLNNRLFKAATDAVNDVQAGLKYVKRFDRDTLRGKIDLDIREQIDELLDRFDFRQGSPKARARPTREQTNLADWVRAQNDAGYSPSVSAEALNPAARMHYADMTVEQFRGMIDSLKSLEAIGRDRQTVTVDGKKVELGQFVTNELVPKIRERGERFAPEELLDRAEDRHTNPVAIALDHFQSWLRAVAAQLKPQAFKQNQFDRHEILGPFGRAIFDPVINAAYHKVDLLKGLSRDFAAMAEKLGTPWQKSLLEVVNDPSPLADTQTGKPMHFTRAKMIGMALHVGNESNFDKLTKGWGWQQADVLRFLKRNMTTADWHAVQATWDLYEKHWPDTVAMYRRLGQTIPEKIDARPFTIESTADGGRVDMRGGYAAITYDALRSRRGEKAAAGQAINPGEGLFGGGYYKSDTPTNGSMNARKSGYTDRVSLDYNDVARKLQETMHDLAYREALINANKIIEHPEFRDEFRKAYGREAYSSMQEWLGQIANAQRQDAAAGALGKFLSYTRTGIVINAIAFRATTVLKHGGSAGIKTLGYFAGGGEKFLSRRMAAMTHDYSNQIASAQGKFAEIRTRLMQQDRDFKVTSRALFEAESALSKAERFGHAAVAWADMMTAVPTAWAAYDRAVTEGIPKSQGGTGAPMTEEQAVSYANKVVREAHGSQNEAGRSMIMSNSNEAVKMFTTLFGFMNTTYGQQLDAVDKLRTAGISNTPVLARTLMAVIVPALWAAYITHGKPDKQKQETWGGWTAKAILGEVAASVPFVRDAVSMVEGYKHAGQVAPEGWLATMVQAGHDIATIGDKSAKGAPIKDIANALGQGLHIPGLGQLGTSLQYLDDVHKGKERADNVKDVLVGLATGHATKR